MVRVVYDAEFRDTCPFNGAGTDHGAQTIPRRAKLAAPTFRLRLCRGSCLDGVGLGNAEAE